MFVRRLVFARYLGLFAVWNAMSCFASNIQIVPSIGTSNISCEYSFRAIGEQLAEPQTPATIYTTHLHDLVPLLKQVSTDKAKAELVGGVLDKILNFKSYPLSEPVLQVIGDMKVHYKLKSDSDVVLCVVSSTCYGKNFGFFTAEDPSFNIYEGIESSFALVDLESHVQSKGVLSFSPNSKRVIGIRALEPGSDLQNNPAFWVAAIFHEFRHLMDLQLMRNWMKANYKLVLHKKSPDKLFKAYARVNPFNSTIMIDTDFFYLFFEGRATEVQHAIGEIVKNEGVSKHAKDYFKSFYERAPEKKRRQILQGSVDPWVAISLRSAEMQKTIDQALQLNSNKP